MGEAEQREELDVLTRGWDAASRDALLAAYARHRRIGASHEEALVRALGDVLS